MEELREKARSYAEENVINILKEAFAKAYSDGYRDGYKDRKDEIPVDLRAKQSAFVDLGLPSGTLWSSGYGNGEEESIYRPYLQAALYQIPSEELWKELVETCEWQGKYSTTGISFYGVTCIGPNGNSIYFSSAGYVKDSIVIGEPHYGGGGVYFWLKDNNDGLEKKAVHISVGKRNIPEIVVTKMFSGFKLPIRLVKVKQ